MSRPKSPLQPNELGALYPHAKTYDELQMDRVAVQKLRDSWQPKHPKLLITVIIASLCIIFWGILEFILPIIPTNPIFAVPTGILLGLAWVYALIGSLHKIRKLLNQIALSSGDQSRVGASHDQR